MLSPKLQYPQVVLDVCREQVFCLLKVEVVPGHAVNILFRCLETYRIQRLLCPLLDLATLLDLLLER